MQEKLCPQCQAPVIKRGNTFCDSTCSAKFNNIRKETKIYRYCAYCTDPIRGHAKRNNKFCNVVCERSLKNLSSDITDAFSTTMTPIRSKARLIRKDHRCSVCGITEWMDQPVPVVLDHIDGNSTNDETSNHRLVCGNCDMQLPTYKAKNTGNGRAWRRQRYAEGKSY